MEFRTDRLLRIGSLIAISALVSAHWAIMAFAARHSPNYYGTIGLAYLIASVVALACYLISFKSWPHLGYRTIAAAFAIAVICYALPSLLVFHALNRLPTLFVGFAFCTTPLWLWIFGGGTKDTNVRSGLYLLGALAALSIIFFGLPDTRWPIDQRVAAAVAVFVAVFLFAMGTAVLRKVFWIHSAPELSFWAMLSTAIVCLCLAQVFMIERPQAVPSSYLLGTLAFGAIAIGLSGHAYRWATHAAQTLELTISTAAVPIGIIVWSLVFWRGELVANAFLYVGTIVFLAVMVFASRGDIASHWMSLHLTNSLRKGDRVTCTLAGFLKTEAGAMSKIDIVDLSVGGLGFRCSDVHKVADELTINIPMGTAWTQINLDSRVMHYQRLANGTYIGGVEFRKLSDELSQVIVEFLARIGNLPSAQQTQGLGKPRRKEVI